MFMCTNTSPNKMRHRNLILLFTISLLGCNSIPKNYIGIYTAANGNAIRIEADGDFYWSPSLESSDELHFVGVLSVKGNHSLSLAVPASSPRLGIEVRYDEENQKIIVNWGECLGADCGNREDIYKKSIDTKAR